MNLDESRWKDKLRPCTPGRCDAPVAELMVGRYVWLVEARPHKDGSIRVRDNGGPDPAVLLLPVRDRFGLQGTLHRRHECKETRARKAQARRYTW